MNLGRRLVFANLVAQFGANFVLLVFALLLGSLLVGCATAPEPGTLFQRSEALWGEQLSKAPDSADSKRGPLLWVLLAGLHDNSKAFEGDVQAMQEALLRINPDAVFLTLNNPHLGGDQKRPLGTRDNLRRALQTMGSRMPRV